MRERLRDKYINLISSAGRWCEQAGQLDRAVEYYRKGLETDNLSEGFCQRLMKCYHKLGWRAEAIKLYQRCRTTLKCELGIEPSSKTEALYREIKGSS